MREVDSRRTTLDVPHLSFLFLLLLLVVFFVRPCSSPRSLSFLLMARRRENKRRERERERRGRAGSSQSESAERRYLKHMQRVQLRSGSHRGREERGKKSRTMAACVRLPGIRLTTIYATSATTTTTTTIAFVSFSFVPLSPISSLGPLAASFQPTLEKRILSTKNTQAPKSTLHPRVPGWHHLRNSSRSLILIINASN